MSKVDFSRLRKMVNTFAAPKALKEIAKVLDEEVKRLILRGISPVAGEKRFIGYKNPEKYPGKRKPKRPVNLKLTGDLLDGITAEFERGKIVYGVNDKNQVKKAIGLLDGANGMAGPRKFIAGQGDKYKPQILNKLKRAIIAYVKKNRKS